MLIVIFMDFGKQVFLISRYEKVKYIKMLKILIEGKKKMLNPEITKLLNEQLNKLYSAYLYWIWQILRGSRLERF